MDIKIPVINAFNEIGDKKKSFAREQKFIFKKSSKNFSTEKYNNWNKELSRKV